MIIKNLDQVSRTSLRRVALEIVEAGFEAIQTKSVIQKNIELVGEKLTIKGVEFDLRDFSYIYVFGAGKGAFETCAQLEKILGERIKAGLVIDVKGGQLARIRSVVGTHPDPSETNVEATRQLMKMVEGASEDSLILFVIAGGGSALLTAPFEVSPQTKASIITNLMNVGADIYELNVVRKHLSLVKGGRLAKLAYPRRVVNLIFSDVPGNDPSTIASGPTVLDESTSSEAETILRKRGVWQKLSLEGLEFTDTPKEEKYFSKVRNIILQEPASVVFAMQDKARGLGWKSRIFATDLVGDASEVGRRLLKDVKKGEILLGSGETTVKVTGDGVGGRNQHLVLTNIENIRKGQVLIAAASDGHDHSDSAGAIADGLSIFRAKEKGLNIGDYIERNDSFEFFKILGDSFNTGLLESNVSDFYLVLQA